MTTTPLLPEPGSSPATSSKTPLANGDEPPSSKRDSSKISHDADGASSSSAHENNDHTRDSKESTHSRRKNSKEKENSKEPHGNNAPAGPSKYRNKRDKGQHQHQSNKTDKTNNHPWWRKRKRKELTEGIVKLKYDTEDKQYVFITNEEVSAEYADSPDIFALKRDFKDGEWPLVNRGDKVKFYLKQSDDGTKPIAKRVRYGADAGARAERKEQVGSKKEIFPNYYTVEKVRAGLMDGSLREGILRVNPKKPSTAYVDLGSAKDTANNERDLLIQGHSNRNRAVHGDRVVVRILPEREEDARNAELKAKKKIEDRSETMMLKNMAKKAIDLQDEALGGDASPNRPATDLQDALDAALADSFDNLNVSTGGDKKAEEKSSASKRTNGVDAADLGSDEDEIESDAEADVLDELAEEEEEDWNDEEEDRKSNFNTAQVVFIADYSGRNRSFVCTLCPNNSEGTAGKTSMVKENEKFVKACPVDKKFPWILIYLRDEVKKKLKVPGKLDKFMYWSVKIDKWDSTSILPLGNLAEKPIGKAGDAEAEVMKALEETELAEHNKDFDDDILDEVEEIVQRTTETFEEIAEKRIDLRKELKNGVRIMTIDPKTARDLDDAIHVKKINNEITEFGVHIADVAHFVKPGSHVDKMAKFRCTSVYMPDRVLPMLPHALCNHLCSLNPNENKCAFSVFFRIDNNGELMVDEKNEPWIAKTVINTCCRFNYDQVQEIYDFGGAQALTGDARPEVYHGASWEECVKDLFLIYKVCTKIRNARFGNGALSMHKSKLIFKTTDASAGMPTGYAKEVHSPSHWVIEELMLLANKSVARVQQKHDVFDSLAVLRNHPPPDEKKAKRVLETMQLCGIEYSNSTAGDLHKCLTKIHKIYGEEVAATASMLTMKCGMRPASYFIGEDEPPHHFALNFDQYTHFTSPIRRYADVMVHRVLNAILEKKTKEQFMIEDLDDADREAVPEKDDNLLGKLGGGRGGNKHAELNTDGLSDDDLNDQAGSLRGTHRRGGGPKQNYQKNLKNMMDDYNSSGFVQQDTLRPKKEDYPEAKTATAAAASGDAKPTDGSTTGPELNEDGTLKVDDDDNNEESDKKCQANIAMGNQCKSCNKKKKASKDCQEELDRAWFCMLLRDQKNWWYRAATVTEIQPDGITVFAHEIGKEKKIFVTDIRTHHDIPNLFVKEVNDEVMLPEEFEYWSKSHMKVTWSNKKVEDTQFLYGDERPDLEETEGQVLGSDVAPPPGMDVIDIEQMTVEQDIHLLSVVPIVLIPTNTVPIDFVMLLVSPYHAQWRKVEITDKERRGFNNAPVESFDEDGDSDDDDNEDYGTQRRPPKNAKGKGKKGGKKGGGKARGRAS
ncbi:unnamed protein product [Amoebophrya sp. A120]|nr:unnamed protein product [Amoebophrya sp. A120]|eukprot:GSA120T00012093001.1